MQTTPERMIQRLAILIVLAFFTAPAVEAQKKNSGGARQTPAKTSAAKKPSPPKTSAKKTATAKSQTSKTKPAASSKSKTSARTAPRGAKSKTPEKTPSKKLSAKERRRLDAERRRAEAEARRRRDQAAREAAERRRQFELGLRNQAIGNILQDSLDGEDLEVRRVATDALGGAAGTVVVMEPKTGRVLSIVNQDWAVRQSFKPCSTIKLVTGIAGINENKIAQSGIISERSFPMNLDDALAYSNNSYFQVVGSQIGNQRVIGYARSLGLGAPTGVNLPGEIPGKLPWNNSNPRIYSHGDDFEVTPLQLAVMVSAITNGGRVVV